MWSWKKVSVSTCVCNFYFILSFSYSSVLFHEWMNGRNKLLSFDDGYPRFEWREVWNLHELLALFFFHSSYFFFRFTSHMEWRLNARVLFKFSSFSLSLSRFLPVLRLLLPLTSTNNKNLQSGICEIFLKPRLDSLTLPEMAKHA